MICRRGEPFTTTSGGGDATAHGRKSTTPCGPGCGEPPGREPQPSGAIVDRQNKGTSEQGATRGYDGANKVCGRKRHLLVDPLGLVLLVVITPANVQDRDALHTLLSVLTTRSEERRVGKEC